MNNDFLIHYGISGQKWGLRRFQNEDRTLTEAGKERYYGSRGKLNKRYRKELKKLDRYEKNADLGYQMQKAEYHKDKAAKNLAKAGVDAAIAVGVDKGTKAFGKKAFGTEDFLEKTPLSVQLTRDYDTLDATRAINKVGTYVFGGAAAIRAGKAAYHGLKASNASRKISQIGHDKAVEKYNKQVSRMITMFESTPLSEKVKSLPTMNG